MHAKDFANALIKRNKVHTQLIEEGNQFLHDNPPEAIGPPLPRNHYFDSLGEFSTSRGHTPRDPPKYCPPSTLPTAVLPPRYHPRNARPRTNRSARNAPHHPRPPNRPIPALCNALWTHTCSLWAPAPPLPLLHHPAATDPRSRTRDGNEMSLPPPLPCLTPA